MKTLILNIKQLVQTELSPRKWVAGKDMARLGILENAYLLVEEDKIAGFGKMEDLNREAVYAGGDIVKEIDATGRLVMPSYCDSHTHLVYAGSREIEYIDKIRGLSYEEIAKRGGGILNSCERIRKASEEELFDAAYDRIQEIVSVQDIKYTCQQYVGHQAVPELHHVEGSAAEDNNGYYEEYE